ncbi:DUF892 family protein [Natrinema ejinorense]|uniref:Uncharacterized protein n=1 Tax=Natrinema ejinorense TaxID=373386 RepID=A0A2A5QXB7_9EURY|nr:DUF892 family protein [Natrinema ejinorense]PCR91471.1 hypothetical protein CP557_13600 [Natrinema ejinorense]
MSMDTIQDLFEHGLEDIYHAEHREETQAQIDRLEEVFDAFGEPPEKEECEGIEGLLEEYEEFTSMDPAQEVMDYQNMAAAEKTEHYEIAAYGNLIPLADQLGMDEAADLLEENLREEQAALDELKELTEGFEMAAIPAE